MSDNGATIRYIGVMLFILITFILMKNHIDNRFDRMETVIEGLKTP